MRYAWDLQHQYLRDSGLDQKWRGYLARYFLHKLRQWDLRSAYGVDFFIANSQYIARRINKTYRRQADVIYPPVDVSQFTPHGTKEDFYLTVSRLVPYKRIDLIVESFAELPDKQLLVIGDGPDFAKIQAKAGANVTLLGQQPNAALVDYMQRAKAFIFAAEEDFGIVPLEAQACGTPVIAYSKGGALETVRGLDKPGPTGVFFAEQTTSAICQAIKEFENNYQTLTVENCVNNAKPFAPQRFRAELTAFVKEKTQ
jgi:glycosyltransferase involved in cell wall biosynthesis